MHNSSPVPPAKVGGDTRPPSGAARPADVFEAPMPLTASGRPVNKVRHMDYGSGPDAVRVVFDAETGETLGVMRPF